jgi:hypothetical protein
MKQKTKTTEIECYNYKHPGITNRTKKTVTLNQEGICPTVCENTACPFKEHNRLVMP